MNSFAEQWQAAITLAEVRGWDVLHEPGRYFRVTVQQEMHAYVYPYDRAGLAALIHQLSQDDPKPLSNAQYKAVERYGFGFTDLRGLYGTTTTS